MAKQEAPNDFKQYKRYYKSLEPLIQKPKGRAYTATVFSFLAISLFGWYGIRPTLQTILFLRREIRDNTEVNTQMEKKIVNLIQAQAAYQQIAPQIPLLREAIPTDPDILPLVFDLRTLATSVDASISAVSIPTVPLLGAQSATPSANPQNTEDMSRIVPIVFSITGQYTSIRQFMEGLLNMRRIVNINSVTIAKAPDDFDTLLGINKLRLTVKADTFYTPGGL